MARSEIKLDITFDDTPVSKEEQDKRLVDFFALLFEWKLEELQNNEEGETSLWY